MLLQQVHNFIISNNIIDLEDKILVAVSGGVDSIVLANILKQLNYNFDIAHCNFNLRGEESDKDHKFVEELAKKYKVKAYFKKFDTSKYANTNKISIQMAARELRYQWLESLLLKYKYNKIATAHHHNDNIETILFNLIKGTGIKGLRGILSASGYIVRPLLFVSKKEIQDYAKSNNLLWREDSSNKKDDYHRNLIRNKLIPIMKSINPNLENTFNRNIERFAGFETFVEKHLRSLKVQKKNDILVLQKSDLYDIIILEQVLSLYGFSYTQCKDIISAKVGSCFISINIPSIYEINRKNVTYDTSSPVCRSNFKGEDCNQYMLNVDRDCIFLEPIKKSYNYTDAIIYENEQDFFKNKQSNSYVLNDKLHLNLLVGDLILYCYDIKPFNTKQDMHDFIKNKIDHNANMRVLKTPDFIDKNNFKIDNKLFHNKESNNPNILLLDKDKLKFPLTIRPWMQGDKFKPLGMNSNKKVSDFLIDNKIPVYEKKNVYVILSKEIDKKDYIVAIVGYRISECFKVTQNTTKVLEIQL